MEEDQLKGGVGVWSYFVVPLFKVPKGREAEISAANTELVSCTQKMYE